MKKSYRFFFGGIILLVISSALSRVRESHEHQMQYLPLLQSVLAILGFLFLFKHEFGKKVAGSFDQLRDGQEFQLISFSVDSSEVVTGYILINKVRHEFSFSKWYFIDDHLIVDGIYQKKSQKIFRVTHKQLTAP